VSAVAAKRLAIIGLGRIAASYRDVLDEVPELELAAIVEPEPQRATEARREGLAVFPSVDEMLGSFGAPHVAIVCTPPVSHYEVAQPLLHAGVDLLIEKPLAPTPEEADRISETAERLGRTIMTAAKFRVTEALRETRRLIEEGRVGRLVYIENTFSGKLDPNASWHGDPTISGGGVWMDNGPHSIDVIETLVGPIERIRMLEEKRLQQTAVEDEIRAEAEHAGGILSNIHLSWNDQIAAPIARVVGTEAEILVGWAQTLVRADGRDEIVAGGYDKRYAFRALLERFLSRRLKAQESDHGAQSVAWIHAGYRSLGSRDWEIA
jgi:predicted dehydrogenase